MLVPLLLLALANSVPWLLAVALGRRGAWPVDFGRRGPDGRRLLGAHKTWRGLISAVAACLGGAAVLGIAPWVGAVFGALAMLGDLLSSFAKRRLNLEPGREVPGLDQLPECLLPQLVLGRRLGLSFGDVVVVTLLFLAGHLALAGLRRRAAQR